MQLTNYTSKFLLWQHNTNKDGLYPIYLKVTINRKSTYKSTGHYTDPKKWDSASERFKSSYPNYTLINARLVKIKNDWVSKIITEQLKGDNISAYELKKSINNDHNNIFEYVDDLIVKLKGKKSDNTLNNYRKHLKKLETYVGSRHLSFDYINTKFLSGYEAWLRDNISFRKEDAQKNYIHAIWKTFKTWFNAAKREGVVTHYPFDNYENPIYVSPDKDYLTLKELEDLEKFADETTDPVLKEVAIYFLFGAYSALRISDWYKFDHLKHIKGDKLRLRPTKTKYKWVEMIISKPLARNLERMKKVPLKLAEPTINEKLKVIAAKLGINKHLTSHSARHTFAVTICLGNNLSSETAAELMGITLSVFIKSYSQVTQAKIDLEAQQAWKNLL